MKTTVRFAASVLIAGVSVAVVATQAAPKAKYTNEEVMKALHKGKDSVGKHVMDGNGTKEEIKKLLEYYPSMLLNDPEKGDKAEWKKRVTALIAATKALDKGTPGALDQYKEAVNCKACHSAHKPDKEHH